MNSALAPGSIKPGMAIGNLVVIEEAAASRAGRRWICRCVCGEITCPLDYALRAGRTRSCGAEGCKDWRWHGVPRRITDRTGHRYGALVVERRYKPGRSGARWECRCDCGAKLVLSHSDLVSKSFCSVHCPMRAQTVLRAGHRIERLVLIEPAPIASYEYPRWRCRCDCGAEVILTESKLRKSYTRSCDRLECRLATKKKASRAVDRSGERFGFLVALRMVDHPAYAVAWECRCDCGNIVAVSSDKLRKRRACSRSCPAMSARRMRLERKERIKALARAA